MSRRASGTCAECSFTGYLKRGLCERHHYAAQKSGRLPKILGRPLEDRFWRYVEKGAATSCWAWLGPRESSGYGVLGVSSGGPRRQARATHLALRFGKGVEVPAGLFACHRCDNPGCVNPDHLFIGTHVDNMRDMVAKGRGHGPGAEAVGEKNGHAKLTDADVIEARRRYVAGERSADLAREYGIARSAMRRTLFGQAWTHLPGAAVPRSAAVEGPEPQLVLVIGGVR